MCLNRKRITIENLAEKSLRIGATLKLGTHMLATVESCTGGLLSSVITANSGSSDYFSCAYVTYSNLAKEKMVNVNPAVIERFGAVSKECARAMAEGAIQNGLADIAVAITGIAGPASGSTDKPVGLVYIAVASQKKHIVEECIFTGDRAAIRMQAVNCALDKIWEFMAR